MAMLSLRLSLSRQLAISATAGAPGSFAVNSVLARQSSSLLPLSFAAAASSPVVLLSGERRPLLRPAPSSYPSCIGGEQYCRQIPQQQVRFATKKAGGSTNNSKDSAGRRLGIKVWPGQYAKAGSIIVRQRGKKFLKGTNVGMGNDHTVFATHAGIVRMERSPKNRKRNIVHVEPEEEIEG